MNFARTRVKGFSNEADFVPIVFGADTLGYSYAREFYHSYGVRTRIVAPVDIKYTSTSRYTDYEIVPAIDSKEGIIQWLREHAGSFGNKIPIAIGGASDAHARTLSQNHAELATQGYCVPYTDFNVLNRITQKDRFYGICEQLGMPFPKTLLLPINGADKNFGCDDNASLRRVNDKDLDKLTYPLIVKPSNSATWHYAKLRNPHKVYFVDSVISMRNIVDDVRTSGYDRYLIIQAMLGNSDDALYSLTLFSDGCGSAPLAVSGHVFVQDRSATGIGNPLVILGESHPELLETARRFLIETGYEGYANFDVMRDAKTGELNYLEVNARPGRNTYYVSLAGCPFVRPIVEHFVHKANLTSTLDAELSCTDDFIFSMLPPAVVRKKMAGKRELDRAIHLLKTGHATNPLINTDDCAAQRFWAYINYEHMRLKY